MPNAIPSPVPMTDALRIALSRGVLPTSLSTEELRQLPAELRARSVFSARTANAVYLQELREVVNEVVEGEMNHATARVTLLETLRAMGYTPEGGFPDSDTPVPPAVEGSLQDLSSFRRLDLIIRTQERLMRGAGQKQRGQDRTDIAPAWELVRINAREVPRDWQTRFEEAGGELINGRMIAHKNDPVWDALGDSALFDDALDVDHPPFAFGSGMGWSEVFAGEWESLGGSDQTAVVYEDANQLPVPKVSTSGLDDDFLAELKRDLKAHEDENGKLTMADILKGDAS